MTGAPALLTPEEAAEIARCSVKTVRRAYTHGALTAHRRRGSRAILLVDSDVVAWAHGEVIVPSVPEQADEDRTTNWSARSPTPPSQSPESQTVTRTDLSAAAMRQRRSTTAHETHGAS